MSELNQAAVETLLKNIVDPVTGRDIVSSKLVKGVSVEGSKVTVKAVINYPAAGWHDTLKAEITEAVRSIYADA